MPHSPRLNAGTLWVLDSGRGYLCRVDDASFIPGVRAPMCVGLGNPEMRTLITFAGEPSALPQRS